MLGGLHIWHLLILAFIVMIVFGTKNLKNFGEDLGGAIHGFKKAMNDGKDKDGAQKEQDKLTSGSSTSQPVDAKPNKVDADK